MISLTECIRNFELNFFTYPHTLSSSPSQRLRNDIKRTKRLTKQEESHSKPNTFEAFVPSKVNSQNDSYNLNK